MYQPRIDEQLIPRLYYLAKARDIAMTVLVSTIVAEAVEKLEQQDRAEVERN